MLEKTGNIWTYQERDPESWVGITTNGFVKRTGECVMGRGVALEAAKRYPHLPKQLGDRITNDIEVYRDRRPRVNTFPLEQIFAVPVKYHFALNADIDLIVASITDLVLFVKTLRIERVYLVRPGCGNGQLTWDSVKPCIQQLLDDSFTIVERNA